MRGDLESLKRELKNLREELEDNNQKNRFQASNVQRFQIEQKYLQNLSAADQEIQSHKKQIESLKEELNNKSTAYSTLEASHKKLQISNKSSQDTLKSLRTWLQNLQKKTKSLQLKAEEEQKIRKELVENFKSSADSLFESVDNHLEKGSFEVHTEVLKLKEKVRVLQKELDQSSKCHIAELKLIAKDVEI